MCNFYTNAGGNTPEVNRDVIRLSWTYALAIKRWIPLCLLRARIGRRELFRTMRAGLLGAPALIYVWWLFKPVLGVRREADPEKVPWEEQAEIGRRDFLRKACDSLGRPGAMGRLLDASDWVPGTGQAWPSLWPDRVLVLPVSA